jgi:hypothetical protein
MFTNSATDPGPCSLIPPIIQYHVHKVRHWSSTVFTNSTTDPVPCSQSPPLILHRVHKVHHWSNTTFTKSATGLVSCSHSPRLIQHRVHKFRHCSSTVFTNSSTVPTKSATDSYSGTDNSKVVSFCSYTKERIILSNYATHSLPKRSYGFRNLEHASLSS